MNSVDISAIQSTYSKAHESDQLGRRRCNLVLIANKGHNHEPGFRKVAHFLREIDPKINPIVIGNRAVGTLKLLPWLPLPTLAISPVQLSKFKVPRGRMLMGVIHAKSQEYEILEAAGFRVPKWKLLKEDDYDLSDFSPYVVTKPDRGMRGAMVKIRRRNRVRPNSNLAKDVIKHGQPTKRNSRNEYTVNGNSATLAQEFVYTGQWPVSYRVTTLFGQVLHSVRTEASHERTPLTGVDAFDSSSGINIVASGQKCTVSLNYDEEIIRLGEAVHAAFPEIPLLGVDIVREVPSGKLYVLEVNANGYVWHFHSLMGLNLKTEFGIELESQFDGIRKAAYILAQKAQHLAA
jgi:hypothetical protein